MPKRLALLGLRLSCVFSMALWAGGLTFYGAFVLPRTHEIFGRPDAALVTREISYDLNLIGVTSLAFWWLNLGIEWSRAGKWVCRAVLLCLIVSSLILAWLFPAHSALAVKVDAGAVGTRAFYVQHRDYLIAISVQWGANLLLLASAMSGWTGVFPRNPCPSESPPL